MSVKIKAGYAEVQFTYLGEDKDLWLKAVERVVHSDLKTKPVAMADSWPVDRSSLRKVKQCVKDSQLVVAVERVLAKVSEGAWKDIDLDFGTEFKHGVRTVWDRVSVLPEFQIEQQILELMRGTGGAHSVEYVATKLWKTFPATFKRVREAMLRLEKLYLVEYQAGNYSYRNNILGR